MQVKNRSNIEQYESILNYLKKPDELNSNEINAQIQSGVNIVSIIAKANEHGKKTYIYKKILLNKGNFPSEDALLNGLIVAVLNQDDVYNALGECHVLMIPDH